MLAATSFRFQGQRSRFIYANVYLTYRTNISMYKILSYRRDSARRRFVTPVKIFSRSLTLVPIESSHDATSY